MDQLMKKPELRLEMAVDRNSWRNGSAPGRPTRVEVQTRASSRNLLCNVLSSFGYVRPVLTRTAPLDMGPFFGLHRDN